MDIYVVVCNDRHTDIDVEVFNDVDNAIEHAKSIAKEYASFPEDIYEKYAYDKWIYFCRYSYEGNYVSVEKCILNEK